MNDPKASNRAGRGRRPGEPGATKSDQKATKSDRKAIEGWPKRRKDDRPGEEDDDVERVEENVEHEERVEGEERVEKHNEEHDDEKKEHEKEHDDPEKEEVPTVEKSAGKASSLFGLVKSTRLNLLTTNVRS